MALQIDPIRAAAERVATSHGLDVVDVAFAGAGKTRALRVFLEKNAEGREKLKTQAAEDPTGLPSGVPVEALSGVTHEDCAVFAQDFGTLLDVEELVPGTAEYTLEVSSPGIERELFRAADYTRFSGFLATVKLFAPINGTRTLTGRMTFDGEAVTLDLSAVKAKGKKKKSAEAPTTSVTFPLGDRKAHLVADF